MEKTRWMMVKMGTGGISGQRVLGDTYESEGHGVISGRN